jgi:hypothetical protein
MPTIFSIASLLSNLVLDVPQGGPPIGLNKFGNKVGDPVQQWKPDQTGGLNQQWTLQGQGAIGWFQLVNKLSGLAVGVTSKSQQYVSLQPQTSQGTPPPAQQLWIPLQPKLQSALGYNLINQYSGLVLDVPMELANGKNGTAPGVPIQQYPNNSGMNQQWSFGQAPSQPQVGVSPTGSIGGDSELRINGVGFTSYKGQEVLIYFYGVPAFGSPGSLSQELLFAGQAETPVDSSGNFSITYTTPPATVTATILEGESQWVSCLVTDTNHDLLAVSSVQLQYFVATTA